MVELKPVVTDDEFEAWRQVRRTVLPNERVATIEEMRARCEVEPDRLFMLALEDGEVVGNGLVGQSSLGGAGVHPRVLPDRRNRGVGTALLEALENHALLHGYRDAIALADDDQSYAWALRRGYVEVDRQIEQVRSVAPGEPAPAPRDDVELGSIAERPELLREAFPVAEQGYADLATFRPVTVTLDEWLREEATLPGGSLVALAGGEVVGFTGLIEDAESADRAEDGLMVVRRDWRGRGLATYLKQAKLAWAAANGIRQIVTWTQEGNASMRALNERLGYVQGTVSRTVRRELG